MLLSELSPLNQYELWRHHTDMIDGFTVSVCQTRCNLQWSPYLATMQGACYTLARDVHSIRGLFHTAMERNVPSLKHEAFAKATMWNVNKECMLSSWEMRDMYTMSWSEHVNNACIWRVFTLCRHCSMPPLVALPFFQLLCLCLTKRKAWTKSTHKFLTLCSVNMIF